ncbi:MAG: adenylate/guanylate cyclase domain-containing protein [Deltaproteobacteria bacterium]|nr:MAG: adenylate/guanylate cyclase domain-containing protein [Deltaproteobacteria bacterium]
MSWAALCAALVALAVLAWRTRRTVAGLERRLAGAHEELERLQQAFSRFAPAEVVEDIIADGLSARSEKKEITVLFADLKGFTELGEGLAPAELVTILNGYLERMSQTVVEHRGHVSKFLGDGILALFGALEANPWQTRRSSRRAGPRSRWGWEFTADRSSRASSGARGSRGTTSSAGR